MSDEYKWGDAEKSTNYDTFSDYLKHVHVETFRIRFGDLTASTQEKLRIFLKEADDARADGLHDDYAVSNVYVLKEDKNGPDLSVGR